MEQQKLFFLRLGAVYEFQISSGFKLSSFVKLSLDETDKSGLTLFANYFFIIFVKNTLFGHGNVTV